MNRAYADLIRARVAGAIAEANALRQINHDGLLGSLRETLVRQLLLPLLPVDVGVTSGVIISATEEQTGQLDLVVYEKRLMPPLLVVDAGLVPAEAALFVIEVKSTLDSTELRSAHEAASRINRLRLLSGQFAADNTVITHHTLNPVPMLFAFDTDLSKKTDLERYLELLANDTPDLRAICVVGRGMWIYENDRWKGWPATQAHDEVLGFLALIVNSIPQVTASRGRPRLGQYFI